MDDGLISGTNQESIEEFLEQIRSEFKITLGSLGSFLGMQISQLEDGSIGLHQEKYTMKILEKFQMSESNPVPTPAVQDEPEDDEEVISESVPYRQAVGSLMYLMTASRPDIAFAVGKASRALEKPTRKNWNEVKRIFRYLRGTSKFGILYKRNKEHLKVFSDADFAGDRKTRRSTSGIVALFADAAVSWSSQLQKTVALSTTEAEIVAASEGTKELIWLTRPLKEMNVKIREPPLLLVDSASGVKLSRNPEYHKRSKHVEVRHFFCEREAPLRRSSNPSHRRNQSARRRDDETARTSSFPETKRRDRHGVCFRREC